MQLFFCPDYSEEKIITLDKEESAHIVRVLRMQEGELVMVTNGKGTMLTCKLIESNPKRCSLEVINKEQDYGKRPFYIHLAIAPTKNIGRMEWLIEKAVEIGVDEISFLLTEHSERKVVNLERLDKIIISAMKQSLKSYRTKLNDMQKLSSFITNIKEENKYLCCCSIDEKIFIKNNYKKDSSSIILIGPEGDFSEKEINMAKENNCNLITLGSQRLRTETAALYAISNIHFLNQ